MESYSLEPSIGSKVTFQLNGRDWSGLTRLQEYRWYRCHLPGLLALYCHIVSYTFHRHHGTGIR